MSECEAEHLISLWILHPLSTHMQSNGHFYPENKTLIQIL